MTLFRTLLPWDPAETRRALLLALAACLSFAVASLLHVHNAYWAAMPVWVISQPARGVLLEKALFRVLGTLAGAAAGYALAHVPGPPGVQIALLALWIAGNAGATHLLRGVHGYAALMAGVTAAVVGIPSLLSPAGSGAIVLARVDCTLIGVVVGSLVMAFQTPESPLAEFYSEVRTVSAEAVRHAVHLLQGGPADEGREERRILGRISHLDSLGRLHAAGSVEGYRRLGDVDLLVVSALGAMAAAAAVRDGLGGVEPAALARMEALGTHLRGGQPLPPFAAPLPAQGDPARQRLDAALGDLLRADLALASPEAPRAFSSGNRPIGLAPHREWTLAWREGALAGVASFAALALALARPAPAMGLAAMGVCVFVMVLGSMPLPQLVAPKLITGVVLGALTAVFYRLVLQPAVTSPIELVLSIVPFALAGGFFRAHPRFGAAGIDFSMCFFMASQAGMPPAHDVPRVLLEAGALMASAGLMAALFMMLPQRSNRQAADAAAVLRRDLLRMLEPGATEAPELWRARGSRQILRLGLHLGRAPNLGRHKPVRPLAPLNLGQALLDLRAQGMPEAVRTLLAAALQNRLAPLDAARQLADMAQGQDLAGLGPALLRLSATLAQAADLLAFEP